MPRPHVSELQCWNSTVFVGTHWVVLVSHPPMQRPMSYRNWLPLSSNWAITCCTRSQRGSVLTQSHDSTKSRLTVVPSPAITWRVRTCFTSHTVVMYPIEKSQLCINRLIVPLGRGLGQPCGPHRPEHSPTLNFRPLTSTILSLTLQSGQPQLSTMS